MPRFRRFSLILAGAALALGTTTPARISSRGQAEPPAGRTARPYPRIIRLAPDVYAYEAMRPQGDYSTNVLIVLSQDGVLVADGEGDADATRRVVEQVAKFTPAPIKWIVIGSDHGDHTGGNAAYPADATWYVSAASKATLLAQERSPRAKPGAWKLPAHAVVVSGTQTIHVGEEEVQILSLGRAHTGGDLEVYLPARQLLYMSETYRNHLFPSLRTGYPTEWLHELDRALAMNAATYVPAHGDVVRGPRSRAGVEEYRQSLQHVIDVATKLHAAGVPVDQAVKHADWGPYASWNSAAALGPVAVRRVYDELDGKLR
jgi:glyoxylase-like metal-dependent hydrolase (beta-lactamase superfamily II)